MALDKLNQFTTFLIGNNLVDENKVDSWMENGKLVSSSKKIGDGFLLCRLHYDAVISLEKYHGDETLFFALICAWLHDHDTDRDHENLSPPDIDVDILDNHTADIMLRIEFREDVEIVPDDNGNIPFDGSRWSIAKAAIDDVDEIAIDDQQDRELDKPYRRGDTT